MTTWRERVAEARARGHFGPEDNRLAFDGSTCAVGEVWVRDHGYGHPKYIATFYRGDAGTGENLGSGFLLAVMRNDFDAADDLLDRIEDAALQLKREATP